jgi:hypothetical protein
MPSIFNRSSFWKYLAAWFVMLLVSVANGAVRDITYGRYVDALAAHQISTATGILLLGLVIWLCSAIVPVSSGRQAVSLGLFWAALTVAFEFLFFHFIGGRSWSELLADYNVLQGRVWVFVVLWVAVAPWIFFRLRGET